MSDLKQFEYLKIKLEAIVSATNNFSEDNCIGKGGFGNVYRGELGWDSKRRAMVALKRLIRHKFPQGKREFWSEILTLSRYKHENIVSLLGFCDDSEENILVYEYATNSSLNVHLERNDLNWVQRLKICIGAARGLAYLHDPAGGYQRVLHRDIKSSNILLDGNWNAIIADLGLSRFGPANQEITFILSNVCGTIGYCDPLYAELGILTKESDVYSFGVVLFEVLCGRLCFVTRDNPQPFTLWVRKSYKQNKLDEIIYSSIKEEIASSSLEGFAAIAYKCLKRDREKRPLMKEIVLILETALRHQSLNVPSPPPAQFPPANSHSSHASAPPGLLRLDSSTELDHHSNRTSIDFAQLVSKERSSRAQPGYGGLNPEAIRLVHPDRATDCETMLRKIREPLPDIINVILALDSSAVIVDQVDALIKICPTKDEMELLKSYKGNKRMLGQCEQFFLLCAKIPRIMQKLRVFAFTTTFSSRVNNLRETLKTIKDATKEIRESTKLVAIMHTICTMGNILNEGTDQGSAEGFKLHSLEKLGDTHATNKQITLLHCLCKVIAEQTPELLDFDKDMIHLEAASMVN